jgi:hypothetical protein
VAAAFGVLAPGCGRSDLVDRLIGLPSMDASIPRDGDATPEGSSNQVASGSPDATVVDAAARERRRRGRRRRW